MLIDSSVFAVLDSVGCLAMPQRPGRRATTCWLPTVSGAMLHRIDRHADDHYFDDDGMCATLCGGIRPIRIGALLPVPIGRQNDRSRSALFNDQAVDSICATWNYVAGSLEWLETARQQRAMWADSVDATLSWYLASSVGQVFAPPADIIVGRFADAWRTVPESDLCWLAGALTAASNGIVSCCTNCQRSAADNA